MARPGTSYISYRSRVVLRKNRVGNNKCHFYTRMIDWSLLKKRAVREGDVLQSGEQQVPVSSLGLKETT